MCRWLFGLHANALIEYCLAEYAPYLVTAMPFAVHTISLLVGGEIHRDFVAWLFLIHKVSTRPVEVIC